MMSLLGTSLRIDFDYDQISLVRLKINSLVLAQQRTLNEVLAQIWRGQDKDGRDKSKKRFRIRVIDGAPVAQLDRASAFEAQLPVPIPPFFHTTFQCLQQLGESASRSQLFPALRISRVLAQFWHSNGRPQVRFKLGTLWLTVVNLNSSQVSGAETNRKGNQQILTKRVKPDSPSLFSFGCHLQRFTTIRKTPT
jgi:hypothetical protein